MPGLMEIDHALYLLAWLEAVAHDLGRQVT